MSINYTALAQIEQKVINFHFPTLKRHYNPMMGNFHFSKKEVQINIVAITRWMEYFPEFKLIQENLEDYDGKTFILTDFSE
jgi:hypothetical protein